MKPPVRTTLVFGLISALAAMPAVGWLAGPVGGSTGFKLIVWLDLLFYALLLTRWGGRHPAAVLFPMVLLLGAALWPGVYTGFFFLSVGVLAWIRSGICFGSTPLRSIMAETICLAGGIGLVALFNPSSTMVWAICIWLFFLMQCLYFFIVPAAKRNKEQEPDADPFEQACRNAHRILAE
ncbi:hypothetical protein DSCO28_05490 [Desulfosarcina ovata subsp. sediminis]|uniref:Uncharacterized protein n=1 Tax=Desulfosarcina ovata subsp. sediminis TaxID=885957 RepID=A0A5K7ZQU6_9BACT|nr:hypothetical protein [Desulfosarcina ovata]BBO79983.1 hypothetical protein DSCO28_05490 [Desulfosarcina ovata subsp. sediminis]